MIEASEFDSCLHDTEGVVMKIFTLLFRAIGFPRSHFKTCSLRCEGGEQRTGGEVPLTEETSSSSVLM